jgi:hypothetical protein
MVKNPWTLELNFAVSVMTPVSVEIGLGVAQIQKNNPWTLQEMLRSTYAVL